MKKEKGIIMDKNTVRQLIEGYTKEDLQELGEYLTGESESAWQGLLDYCQRKEKGAESDRLSLIIEK